MSRRRLHLPLLIALVLAGACGSEETEFAPVPEDTAEPATTAGEATSTTSVPTAAGFATTEQSTPPQERGLLRTVRAARQPDGTERVTFEFEGAVPGYRIGYVDRPLREDGSGDEVTVDGAAVLGVHFEPASGVELSGEDVRTVYRGPNRLDLTTTTILDVVRVSDFEANLDWAVGLDSKVAFKVSVRRDPGRVVVDVQPSPGT